jgi:hypothetical protein
VEGFGLERAAVGRASNDAVLNVDRRADDPELAEISRLSRREGRGGVHVPRRRSGEEPLRLVPIEPRLRPVEPVHRRPGPERWTSQETRRSETIFSSQGDREDEQYSEFPRQMFEQGRKGSVIDLTVKGSPFKTYFLRMILDGFEGYMISTTTALLAFTKYVKPGS